MAAAQSVKRILARVTVDNSHRDLLQDLLAYTGRRRAKRLVFLAALGKLTECGLLNIANGSSQYTERSRPAHKNEDANQGEPTLRPIESSSRELGFLSKLRNNLS